MENTRSRGTPQAKEIESERAYLLRYARLQLRNPAQAEDAVQETLLAAIEGAARFSGKSSLRTWLTGILKHKVIDQLRRSAREQPLEAADDRAEAEAIDALFAGDGHWRDMPSDWGNPDAALENSRFRAAFELCLQRLPERTARAFTMREVMEMTTPEICQELQITSTHCWVLLHRARLTLRECLEITWFDGSRR
ncbi:MAG: sigma-70 family RNA polymerase sigma factor [Burkholderiales bacterium]|nr:sigma-70 family RNA polymerase sigma factor [Burkholderiales bacterium]